MKEKEKMIINLEQYFLAKIQDIEFQRFYLLQEEIQLKLYLKAIKMAWLRVKLKLGD